MKQNFYRKRSLCFPEIISITNTYCFSWTTHRAFTRSARSLLAQPVPTHFGSGHHPSNLLLTQVASDSREYFLFCNLFVPLPRRCHSVVLCLTWQSTALPTLAYKPNPVTDYKSIKIHALYCCVSVPHPVLGLKIVIQLKGSDCWSVICRRY